MNEIGYSQITITIFFQAFERQKNNHDLIIPFNYICISFFSLFLTLIVVYCISIGNTMYRNGNTE